MRVRFNNRRAFDLTLMDIEIGETFVFESSVEVFLRASADRYVSLHSGNLYNADPYLNERVIRVKERDEVEFIEDNQ